MDLEWHEALTRRLRALLKTAPFHQLRASEGRVGCLRPHDDTVALCIKALEVLVDALGLRAGVPREELAEALLPLLEAGDRAASAEPDVARHREAVEVVLGALLNDAGRRQAHQAEYLDFAARPPVARTLRFRLASEQETPDGRVVLRAETDGVNLFLRSLDVDLEDAQAAAEAVVRSQLERGRLDLAVHSAREAQIRSLQFQDQVHALVRRTKRDVGRVDWRGQAPRLLEEARRHLESRLAAEREIREAVEESLAKLAGTPEAAALVRIRDLLDDCLRRHTELHQPLIGAHQLFRDEQARQRFAPLPLRPLPAVEAELLRPVLGATLGEALPAAEAFRAAALPAAAPPLLDLGRLWDRLLRPPREVSLWGRVLDEAPLEALPEPEPRFPAEMAARADARLRALREPTPLSRLLLDVEEREAELVALRALQLFGPEGGRPLPLAVERTEAALATAHLAGDDLLLLPEAADGA